MCSCHYILECYNLFPGVKLSIRSFRFIIEYRGRYLEYDGKCSVLRAIS